ncbi:MAG: phosphoribosylamine--glycine ligase [Chloroflexi bacterium]|nr:phosphoribosylamine--glycine ligase [Chloroflexota bacterium]
MKVLVLGSGGREHALAWRLGGEGAEVLVAPGNGGTPNTVAVATSDSAGLMALAERERVDLTIVGPEAPLAAGLVDAFTARGLAAFGPTRAAARLEWSKAWAKDFLHRHHVPTADAEVIESAGAARRAVARIGLPVVLKADGLAAGKGVFVVTTPAEVDAALDQLFGRRNLGPAADHVLVEECLEGLELSVLAFCDGERLAVMPAARDYKRLGDGDRGPNTGGMGGYTRPGYAGTRLLDEVEQRILRPTLAGMAAEGHPYRGVLYAGLMLTRAGPQVIEFNSRFGDPECQLIMPLLASPLGETCLAAATGQLRPADVRWVAGRTYGVVLAAPGYPEAPRLGEPIAGLSDLPHGVLPFHAGTRQNTGLHAGTGQVDESHAGTRKIATRPTKATMWMYRTRVGPMVSLRRNAMRRHDYVTTQHRTGKRVQSLARRGWGRDSAVYAAPDGARLV